jgi:hypothetical protein
MDNIGRSERKLKLRAKYDAQKKLTPSFDAKIWKYEVKNQKNDLEM